MDEKVQTKKSGTIIIVMIFDFKRMVLSRVLNNSHRAALRAALARRNKATILTFNIDMCIV